MHIHRFMDCHRVRVVDQAIDSRTISQSHNFFGSVAQTKSPFHLPLQKHDDEEPKKERSTQKKEKREKQTDEEKESKKERKLGKKRVSLMKT